MVSALTPFHAETLYRYNMCGQAITLNRKCKHIIARNCDFKLLQPKSLALELQRTYEGKQLS